MKKLKDCISSQVSVDENSMDHILSVFEPLDISKGDFFLKSGEICRKMAFIESGYMRMYDIFAQKKQLL